ncbi:MAG: hypothetical protein M1826_007470 [Phylliscum demangeonii]|nr:MAG: hypothetical protein M1826_007470 [Phylliscum demangeonii]
MEKDYMTSIRVFYQANRQSSKREAGIRSEDFIIEGFVVAFHILAQSQAASPSFWDVVTASLIDVEEASTSDVRQFDRFNNLAHLRHEESRGSPEFLEELDKQPNLDVQPSDRCFNILLKLIAIGFKVIRHDYPEKKIRNMVFRLIPNHGRQYPRGEAVDQEAVDALRNHHDLLCTLYWVSPPSCRPSVSILRDLINAEVSHAEACRVNLRTWLNLIRFQLSTDEQPSALQPFAVWHNTLTAKLIQQYTTARREAEVRYSSKNALGGCKITSDLLKAAVYKSQQQVEGVLLETLTSLRTAMSWCRSTEAAIVLLNKSATVEVFGLFEAGRRRTDRIVVESLEIVQEFIQRCRSLSEVRQTEAVSEDSQEYGDWSALAEVMTTSLLKPAAVHLESEILEPLARLRSNVFRSEMTPDEALLLKLIDVWVLIAQLLIDESLATLNDYIDPSHRHSWTALSNTEQTRKHTPYFLTLLLQEAPLDSPAHQMGLFRLWIRSLVERESLLRGQGHLTSIMIDRNENHPMFQNLPFYRPSTTSRRTISLQEFKDNRLALISCIIKNMSRHVADLACSDPSYADRRKEIEVLIDELTDAMKRNYLEIKQDPGSGELVTGAYVDFVHPVVEVLGIYAFRVDSFFRDGSTFPRPESVLVYGVAKLKSYGASITTDETQRQFPDFFCSLLSTAVAEKKEAKEVAWQLASIISGEEEIDRPTLRAFLVEGVFPAYIERSFLRNSIASTFSTIVLTATGVMFEHLMPVVNTSNAACIESVRAMVDHFLHSCVVACLPLAAFGALFEHFRTFEVLAVMVQTITSCLSVLEYVQRMRPTTVFHATKCLPWLFRFTNYVLQLVKDRPPTGTPLDRPPPHHPAPFTPRYRALRRTMNDVYPKLLQRWTYVDRSPGTGHAYALRPDPADHRHQLRDLHGHPILTTQAVMVPRSRHDLLGSKDFVVDAIRDFERALRSTTFLAPYIVRALGSAVRRSGPSDYGPGIVMKLAPGRDLVYRTWSPATRAAHFAL